MSCSLFCQYTVEDFSLQDYVGLFMYPFSLSLSFSLTLDIYIYIYITLYGEYEKDKVRN